MVLLSRSQFSRLNCTAFTTRARVNVLVLALDACKLRHSFFVVVFVADQPHVGERDVVSKVLGPLSLIGIPPLQSFVVAILSSGQVDSEVLSTAPVLLVNLHILIDAQSEENLQTAGTGTGLQHNVASFKGTGQLLLLVTI